MIKVVGFLIFLGLVACDSGRDTWIHASNGERLRLPYEQTVNTVMSSEPPSLDWLKSSDTSSSWVQEHLMQGLVRFDLTQPGLVMEPGLALSWQSFEKAKRWRFQLRKGVVWTDGVPFNSTHVVDAFHRILTPSTAAIAVDNIFPIKNAKAFNSGVIKDFSKVGVKALGEYEVEFILEEPMGFFPMLLTHHTTFPIRMDVINKNPDTWTEPENIVTLGPYKMIHWHHDSRLVLERNLDFYGEQAKIKYLVFYMIEKPATVLRMFQRGKLDLIRDLPSSEIARLKEWPEFHDHPGLRLYYYGFKVNKPPFHRKEARQAISQAIDRQQLVKVLGGGQKALTSWVPHGLLGQSDEIGLSFDPQAARRKLKNGKSLKGLTIGFNSEEKHRRAAENIQAQLIKNLDLRIELKNEEWKTFLDGLRSESAYSLFRLGWVGDYGDPHNFMAIMTSYSVNNRTGWKNQRYDELVKAGLQESDPKRRLEIYSKAQKILVEEEVPVIPLFTDVNQVLVSQRLENFHGNLLDLYHFHTMGLRP